jgi:MATE family multidrug resistance protein
MHTASDSGLSDSSRVTQNQIWAIAWPMILANVATTLIGLIDTAILGHLNHAAYIGGAAVATSLFNIIYMSLAFLRMGTTGLIAQHYGEKQWQDLFGTLGLSVGLALLIGFSILVVANWLFDFAIPLIGGSADVQTIALEYALIRVISSPAVLFNFVALGFLIGIQKSRQALLLLIFSQAINISLDFYLAVHLDWQVAGIAWATVISDFCGSILALFFMVSFLRGKIKNLLFFPELRKKLLSIFNLNRELFFRTIILISIFAFITAQSAKQGDLVLAANSILIQVFFFLANAVDGFANAAESKTGEMIGAHRNNKNLNLIPLIATSYSYSLQQAYVFLLFCFAFLFFFSKTIIGLISNQIEVINTTLAFFPWLYLLLSVAAVCFVIDGVFIGAAKGRAMLLAISVSTLFVFFPAWYVLQGMGNNGLWLALCLFMLFRSALSQFIYQGIQKKQNW